MRKRIHLALVAIISASTVATATNVSPVSALTYPAQQIPFPECASAAQEFCVETFEFTPTGGAKRTVADPAPNYIADPTVIGGRTELYMGAFMSSAYSGPTSIGAMPAAMAINFYDPVGSIWPTAPAKTAAGIPDGTYRVVVRTGDYDPSIMMLQAKYVAYTVTKGTDGYFTIDLTVNPTPSAQVVAFSDANGNIIDDAMQKTCKANNWVTGCEANLAFRGWALASFGMLPTADLRESARGTWINSNASVLNLSPAGLLSGNLDVDAQGPHYVPTDFGVAGLTSENGRELNPAFFEMYVPYTMLAYVMTTKMGRTVTTDQVKAFLAKPTDVLEGTIEEVPAGASAVVEKVQTLGLTQGDNGVRVNFNLTHYSAPNPTLKIKAPTTTSAGTTGPATTGATPKKLKNGATVNVVSSASKGKTLSAKALFSPSSGAKITKVATKTKTICTVKGTSVKMLKAGTCKVTVTVTYKKKSASTSASVVVS